MIIDVFAFQEALLAELILAIAVIALAYRGFGRWLQHKERMGQHIAEQTAERAAQYGAHIERVEARLKAVEQIVSDDGAQTAGQIDSLHADPLPEPISKPGEIQAP
jgi:hypothetical protein